MYRGRNPACMSISTNMCLPVSVYTCMHALQDDAADLLNVPLGHCKHKCIIYMCMHVPVEVRTSITCTWTQCKHTHARAQAISHVHDIFIHRFTHVHQKYILGNTWCDALGMGLGTSLVRSFGRRHFLHQRSVRVGIHLHKAL